MKTLRNIIGGLALIAGLSGCSQDVSKISKSEDYPNYAILVGKPLGVAIEPGYHAVNNYFSLVLDTEKGFVLAKATKRNGGQLSDCAALIQSEINDGDSEPITLTGNFNEEGTFDLKTIKVNGYQEKF